MHVKQNNLLCKLRHQMQRLWI